MQSSNSGRKINILSIDGGGVRGISPLYILQTVSRYCNGQPPHEVFDLICGTSTGGIIAIMLGILKMDLEECIACYNHLANIVFDEPLFSMPQALNAIANKPKYYAEPLERIIQENVRKVCGEGTEHRPMKENTAADPTPKVFVVAQRKEGMGKSYPWLFRNYDPLIDNSGGTSNVKIWEAARATSAAPTYFPPMNIDGFQYIDGGVGDNNPTTIALDEEVYKAFPGCEIGLVVSLGTGIPSFLSDTNAKGSLLERFKNIATDSVKANDKLENRLSNQKFKTFFRFNVGDIGNFDLSATASMAAITVATQDYLAKADTKQKMLDLSLFMVGIN